MRTRVTSPPGPSIGPGRPTAALSGSSNQKSPTVPGPGVRADDGAERRRRPRSAPAAAPRATSSSSAREPLGRRRVREPDPQRRRVASSPPRAARRTPRAPSALPRTRLSGTTSPSLDRQDRLHVEQRAGERRGAADPAAAGEVVERVDREEQPVLAPVALDERVDLLVGRAALEPPLDREREHRDRRRDGARVDHAHRAAELAAAAASALANVPESVEESWSESIRS